uniref:Uncharacterized protein n=1 Tax=Mus spicilegus TaxID=10103 RepID=A0A8C6IKC9_MUSSI
MIDLTLTSTLNPGTHVSDSLLFHRTSTFALTTAVAVLFFQHAFGQNADLRYKPDLWPPCKHKHAPMHRYE